MPGFTRSIFALALLSTPLLAQQPTSPKPIQHPTFPAGDATPLGAKIATLLADPSVSRAHWGIAVTALNGTPIYGLDEGKLFRPASNAKLFTTAAAMAMLGPEQQFTTTVVGRGTLTNGILHGELVLRGGGDANFAGGYVLPYEPKSQRPLNAKPVGLADFNELAQQVADAGVREIDGVLVGDDTRFENTPYPESWAVDDLLWGYGAPVSALTVHDNQLDLKITPVPPGKQAKDTITLEPDVPFYTVNATPSGTNIWAVYNADFGGNQVLEEREPYSRDFHITGDVAAKYGPYTDELAIDRPAEFAAAALKQALERKGILIKGEVHAQHYDSGFVGSFSHVAHETPTFAGMYQSMGRPTDLFTPAWRPTCQAQATAGSAPEQEVEQHELARKLSVPLAEDVKLTLKESQNLHAEIMLRNLGVESDCTGGASLRTALAWARAFFVQKVGLDGQDFEFYDGSGLSAKDLVTPRATAQLLTFATTQPWFAQWKAALPIGGVDGTLSSRFKEAPLKSHVFAKTGTLGESRALSGYVDCASGKQVIFSIMVDNHSPTSSADRAVMDKIVAAIAATQ